MKVASSNSLLYNPGRLPQEELLALFTVRENEFRIIWENVLHTEPRSSDQNFLVTGQRGMGKTTLLLKVAYEIQREPRLRDWLIPVVFPEELYGVRSLIDLWVKTAEVLDSNSPDLFPTLLREIEQASETMNDSGVLNTLIAQLDKGGHKLVLFIDNFGDLLTRLPELEVRRLRAILMSARHLRLIAASARVIDQTYEYDKPLLDFFYNIHLQDLNKAEAYQLIQSLATWRLGSEEAAENWLKPIQSRIEPIRRLTGGSPRMLVLLMKALMENEAEELLPTMEAILDQVTPYYKHIVEDLKPQQQEIFHATAMAWDGATSGEIAQSMKLDSKKVSAQMLQMEASGYLEKVQLDNKNLLYRLQDRFFNIWYLMRMAGYKGANRMKWLLAFFEAWLPKWELKAKVLEYEQMLMESGRPEDAKALGLAYDESLADSTISSPEVLPFNMQIRNAGSWKEAKAIIQRMPEGMADVVTYNILINRAINWQEALWIWEQMPDYMPDVVTYSILINRASDWQEAQAIFKNMPEGMPDVVTYNTLINRTPDWREAMCVITEMIQAEIVPNLITFGTAKGKASIFENFIEYLDIAGQTQDLHAPKFAVENERHLPIKEAILALWNNDFQKAETKLQASMENYSPRDNAYSLLEFYLLLLLVKHQHHTCLQLFEESAQPLKDLYKPIWYALMKLLGPEKKKEFLRMGPELAETVDEIIDMVLRMRQKYR